MVWLEWSVRPIDSTVQGFRIGPRTYAQNGAIAPRRCDMVTNSAWRALLAAALAILNPAICQGTPAPTPQQVAAQPLLAQIARLRAALETLGSPLDARTKAALDRAARETSEARIVQTVQEALDPHCLLSVTINPESRVSVARG